MNKYLPRQIERVRSFIHSSADLDWCTLICVLICVIILARTCEETPASHNRTQTSRDSGERPVFRREDMFWMLVRMAWDSMRTDAVADLKWAEFKIVRKGILSYRSPFHAVGIPSILGGHFEKHSTRITEDIGVFRNVVEFV